MFYIYNMFKTMFKSNSTEQSKYFVILQTWYQNPKNPSENNSVGSSPIHSGASPIQTEASQSFISNTPLISNFTSIRTKVEHLIPKGSLANNTPSTSTNLTSPPQEDPTQNYATYWGNDPDITNAVPKAIANNHRITHANGKIKAHAELARQKCDIAGCIGKFCAGLCGNPIGSPKSIAHVTHGQSTSTEVDKRTVPLSGTDFKGKHKIQNGVFYASPHETKGSNNPDITKRINNNLSMQKIIINNEDQS